MVGQVCELEGEIKRMVYRGENGFTILNLEVEKGVTVTVKGEMPPYDAGMNIWVQAEEMEDPKWGKQYKVIAVEERGFSSTDAIAKYLAGPAFHGVGERFTEKLVKIFGMETLEILDKNPAKLFDCDLDANKLQILIETWQSEREQHRLIAELMQAGLTMNLALKAQNHFKDETLHVARKEPYRLTEVYGIGFSKADEIAMKNGISPASIERAAAGVEYALAQSLMNGHCYLPMLKLGESTRELLKFQVTLSSISDAIDALKNKDAVKVIGDKVYLSHLYNAEIYVAETLREMLAYSGRKLYETQDALRDDLVRLGVEIQLAPKQLEALFIASNSRVAIITGGAGVGKSTALDTLCKIFEEYGVKFNLCSPTGRASKRLMEVTGREAATIHRLLGFNPDGGFKYNESAPLPTDAVIADESSMIDLLLFRSLLEAMESNDRLILIGDANQLPSVGAGNVLRDLIKSGVIPTTKLDVIFRQDKQSYLVKAAHSTLQGIPLDLKSPAQSKGRNCMFAGADTITSAIETISHLVSVTLPKSGFKAEDIQVITPMREKGLGINDLNPVLQRLINPPSAQKLEIEAGIYAGGKKIFREGDRVMHLKNNYVKGVFNGDVGLVVGINKAISPHTVAVQYPDMSSPVIYTPPEFDEINHSYVVTTHKSQGAEFPVVIMVMHQSQWNMMQRNLFYTGMTRARKLCIVVGSEAAVNHAVSNGQEAARNTTLAQAIQKGG